MEGLLPIAAGRSAAGLRSIARRPTFWVEVGVALAWIALVVGSGELAAVGGSSGLPAWASGSMWLCDMPGMSGPAPGATTSLSAGTPHVASLAAGAPMWALMAVAMMLPTAMPAVRHVAVNSLYWRRRRAVFEFLVVYLGIWVAFSTVALGMVIPLAPASQALLLPLSLAVAAAWQWTPLKRRALRACHRPRALPPRGLRATVGVARFGLGNGSACLASCWAMMLAMAAAGSVRLVWMAVIATLIAVEKLNLKPVLVARRIGVLLGAVAIATAGIAAVGGPTGGL